MKTTIPTSLRLTSEAKRLLRLLAETSGLSMTAVLEILIRDSARNNGIPLQPLSLSAESILATSRKG